MIYCRVISWIELLCDHYTFALQHQLVWGHFLFIQSALFMWVVGNIHKWKVYFLVLGIQSFAPKECLQDIKHLDFSCTLPDLHVYKESNEERKTQ